jgi:hypothetical protein
MKKLLLLGVLLLPAVPSLIAGIETDQRIFNDRRESMINEVFISWCSRNGYRVDALTARELDRIAGDVWVETDAAQLAIDSIDSVLTAEKRAYFGK